MARRKMYDPSIEVFKMKLKKMLAFVLALLLAFGSAFAVTIDDAESGSGSRSSTSDEA